MRTSFIEDLQSDFAVAEQYVSTIGETAWEELSIGMTLPANTTSVVAYMKYESGTEVYFDDLKIELNAVPVAMVVQENHYYPFGLGMKGLDYVQNVNQENKFQYNGKEKQPELSLNWYDYGARNYDAQIGRWHNIDPMADAMVNWSPYNYVFNNPIRMIDPDGMSPRYNWTNGTYYDTQTGAEMSWEEVQGYLGIGGFGSNNQQNGKGWSITKDKTEKGVRNVELSLSVKVLNGSSVLKDEEKRQAGRYQFLVNSYIKEAEGILSGTSEYIDPVTKQKITLILKTKINVEFVDFINDNSFVIDFVNPNKNNTFETSGFLAEINGRTTRGISNFKSNYIEILIQKKGVIGTLSNHLMFHHIGRTIAHELGHSLGLNHAFKTDDWGKPIQVNGKNVILDPSIILKNGSADNTNLMNGDINGRSLNSTQMLKMISTIKGN
jgi:RHS repeat-associated protein